MGVAAGIALAIWDAKRRKISTDVVLDMTRVGVICAIVFARLYYVVFDTQGTFANDFMAIFRIWDGGLAIYGGVIGGALGIFAYSRIKKFKLSVLFDIAAPSLAIGQAIGRWGNFINQEAFWAAGHQSQLAMVPLCYIYRKSSFGHGTRLVSGHVFL